jgi:hypothetical protein
VIRRGRAHTPADESDHLHHRLLRARRQRPRGCCAAEERYELAAFHGTPPGSAVGLSFEIATAPQWLEEIGKKKRY